MTDNIAAVGFSLKIIAVFTCDECGFEVPDCDEMLHHLTIHNTQNGEEIGGELIISDTDRQWYKQPLFGIPTSDPGILACTGCSKLFTSIKVLSHHFRFGHLNNVSVDEPSAADDDTVEQFIGEEESIAEEVRGVEVVQNVEDMASQTCQGESTEGCEITDTQDYLETDGCKKEPQSNFLCALCRKTYVTRTGLSRHMFKQHSVKVPPPCSICSHRFSTPEELAEHILEHSLGLCSSCGVRLCRKTEDGDDVIKLCGICCVKNQTTEMKVEIVENRAETSAEDGTVSGTDASEQLNVYCCNTCCGMFADINSFYGHSCIENQQESSTSLSAPQVNSCIENQQESSTSLSAPQVNISETDSNLCPTCHKSCKSQKQLRSHIRRNHAKDNSENSSTRPILPPNGIMSSNDALKPRYVCELCDETLWSLKGLRRHQKSLHTPEVESAVDNNVVQGPSANEYVCTKCGGAFFTPANLMRHERLKNCFAGDDAASNGSLIHGCPMCGRRFAKLCMLRRHKHAHDSRANMGSNGLNFLCTECGKWLGCARKLHEHMLRHANYRPFACTFCPKRYFRTYELDAHLGTHGQLLESKFICEICGHACATRPCLQQHVRFVHPKPGQLPQHVCTICSRRYYSARALQLHGQSHEEKLNSKRKVMCSICKLLFRHFYNLAHHIKTVHDGTCPTPFSCATCGSEFESGEMLRKHYRSKHRNR